LAAVEREITKATASSETGSAWASDQFVFDAGQLESARSSFADCT